MLIHTFHRTGKRNKLLLRLLSYLPAIANIGMMQDKYPKANPWIILMAAPDLQDSASLLVGLILINNHTHVYLK